MSRTEFLVVFQQTPYLEIDTGSAHEEFSIYDSVLNRVIFRGHFKDSNLTMSRKTLLVLTGSAPQSSCENGVHLDYNQTQVQLPVAVKAKLVRRGQWKRKLVYSNAGHPRRWGTLVPKPVLTSQCRLRFPEGGRGKVEQREQREEVESSRLRGLCASQQSVQITVGKSANLLKLEHLRIGVCLL